MKNRYVKNIRRYARAWILLLVSVVIATSARAQTITIDNQTEINDAIADGIYTYDDLDVEYTAADYPSGTTFYLVLDTNGNGLLDSEEDDEDLILDQSNSLTGTLSGSLTAMTGSFNFYVIAGEDGSLGIEEDNYDLDDSQFTQSGSVGDNLTFDDDLTERSLLTPSYDLTNDNYLLLRIDLTATNVTQANAIVVEYSTDGTNFLSLSDQFSESTFYEGDGTLLFALSQTLNIDGVEFRLSQTNGATLNAAVETWTVGTLNIQEYTGTMVQFDEEYFATINILAPSFTINDETYDQYIGETVELDYRANGFTTGATFYMYSGDILDPEDRIIYESSESSSAILTGTWPLDMGDDNIDVRIAGVYGNIDDASIDFENDLTIQGSNSSGFWFYFNQAGVRSATTDIVDLTGEDYVTLNVGLYAFSGITTDDAILVQYSTDGIIWTDLEDDNGEEEHVGNFNTVFNYSLEEAAKTATTQFRVRQKSVDLLANELIWYVHTFNVVKYEIGAQANPANPYVENYSVTVSNLQDADDASIVAGSIYPGDEITVTASVAGFDVETEDYTVLINNSFLLDNEVVTIDGVTDEISIVGTIPLNVEYDDEADIHVKIYDGAEPLVQVNENVFDDYEIEEITVVGTELEDGDTDAEFAMAGDRSLTTPSFAIASTDALTLGFTLTRVNSVRSPAGTDIVVEYSTNGTDFTEIESISINDAAGGESYSYDNTTLPSGMASPTTSIRFRQASNNGLDLDVWKVEGITLMGGTNISDPGYINYSSQMVDILSPAISLTAIDNVNQDLYPGSELSVEFEIFGEFPVGTTYELIMDREFGGSISFGDFSAGGTYNVTVPSVGAGTYSVYILASHEETESNWTDLVVSEVSITNIVITSSDAVTDGNDDIVYPGNTIDIAYEVVGVVSDDAVVNLEVYDHATDEYMFVEEDQELNGSLSTSLPIGIDYDGNDVDFRFTITNGNLTTFVSDVNSWSTNESNAVDLFPLDSRVGYQSSNLWYNVDGERSGTSIPLDFSQGGRIMIGVSLYQLSYYFQDQEVFIQYSIDEGEVWEELESGMLVNSTAPIFPSFIDIPEEAWVNNVLIRFITNEDEAVSGLQNIVYLSSMTIENFEEIPVAEEEFTLNDDLLLEHLSVSMSTIEDSDFILGESFVVEYNAEGPFESDVDFAVVMEQNGTYVILAESDQTGAVQLDVSIPAFPFEDTDASYNLDVIPFVKLGTDDVYRASSEVEEISEEADILEFEGRATSSTGSSGYSDFRFNQKGDRSFSTRAFDLENFGSATLDFEFIWYDGDYTTLLTLVELEVSTDGGNTYEVLPIPDATYQDEGLVYPSGSYSIDIPEGFLTSETQFRWNQQLNLGEDEDNWRVYSISVNKGETNALNDATYISFNMQDINVVVPNLDNYTWEQADMTDAVFNGETFDYSWNIDGDKLDESNFPASTEYVFTINQEDPETGENIVIGATDVLGVFEASVPSYLENDTYEVMVTASVTVDDEVHYIFEEEFVANLDVFLNTIVTEYAGDDNAVIYAGNSVTFSILKENDETSSGSLDALYANLIMTYDGKEWLMAAQLGAGDISTDLPSFITGSTAFRVEFSEEAPIGTVGEILDPNSIGQLEDDAENFVNGSVDAGSDVTFDNSTGRGLITSRIFEVGELAAAELFEFDLTFNKLPSELTADQAIIFEFSLDGGESFTTIESYPATDAEETLNAELFSYAVSDEMKANETILRWRQEEINGSFYIENIGFTFAEILPFDYLGTSISINEQALLITGFAAEEACLESDITLSYEIRGKFGADNMVTIYYDEVGGSDDLVENYQFNLVEGSGDLVFTLQDLLSSSENNADFKFYLYADDESDADYTYTVQGPVSENAMEIIAPIPLDASFSVPQQYLCDTKDIEVSINGLQNYFTYELLNKADGSSLGSLTYDPDVDVSTINIGALVDAIEMELSITAASSTGNLSCNSIVSTATEELVINPVYELYRSRNNGSTYLLSVGDSETICESNHDLILRTGRIVSNGSSISYLNTSSSLEWFRDDLNTSLGNATTWSTFSKSGDYFARVTDGNCTYLTEAIAVTVMEVPDRPEVTVVSGDLTFCEGQGAVVLEAPDGYNYYVWSTNETSRQITVEDAGSYTVTVSDLPSSLSCASSSSVPVVIESSDMIDLKVQSAGSTNDQYAIQEGEVLQSCDSRTVYFYDNTTASFDGTIAVMLNGTLYGSTTGSSFSLEESGEYSVVWSSDDLTASCTVTSPTFTVEIVESPEDAPLLTSADALIFCEGTSATLEAEAGFAYYRWYRNNSALYLNSSSIIADESGRYQVQVSNVPFENGCSSDLSKALEISVTSDPGLSLSGNYAEGETLNICSDSDFYLQANNSGSNGVTWYHDGVVVAGNSDTSTPRLDVTASGAYYAEIVEGGLTAASQCTYQTVTVNVVYSTAPLTDPEITTADELIFCDQGSVTLTATAGFSYYRWYLNSSVINSNTASIVVDESGDYEVEVSDIPFSNGCFSERSNVVSVVAYTDPDIYIAHSSTSTTALDEGEQLVFCEGDGSSLVARNIGNSPVTWYLDGAAIAGSGSSTSSSVAYHVPTASGVYHAEVTIGGVNVASQCSFQTNTVTVTVAAIPVAQTITSTGVLEFCEGEGEVVLSTQTGFTTYQWMRNGSSINDGDGFDQTNNTYTVYSTGEYSVVVGNDGCLSEESNVIQVDVRDLPATASFYQTGTSCGEGSVEFTIYDGDADPGLVYQLMDRATGLPSGSSVASDGNELKLVSGSIAEDTEFYLEISYADGSSCTTEGTSYVTGSPNNVMLELTNGNVLLRTISSFSTLAGSSETKWYRNGVHLFQQTGESLTVADAAEYMVEVVFDNGCTVTSNSIDLAPAVVVEEAGRTNVSSAKTYPNPSTNDNMSVDIEGDDMGTYNVSIMSMTGLVMKTFTLEKDEVEFAQVISLAGLKQGIYNLRVSKGDDYKNIRILKN